MLSGPLVFDTHEMGRKPGAERTYTLTVPAPADMGYDVYSVPEDSPMEIELRLEAIMRSDDRAGPLSRQRELLLALVEVLDKSDGQELEAEFALDFAHAADDAARRRVVIDQVASLTDASARTWALRLLN